jgi:dipeptidyl aminopeptidase/acylaminoacyl peptidase
MMQEKIFFKNPRGERLAGVLHLPGRKAPGIIFAHGFTMDKENKEGICEALCEAGFAVLRFDAGSCGESEGDFFDFTITKYAEDARAAFDFLSARKEVSEIGMTGHSLGGFVTVLSAAVNRGLKAIVSVDAPYNFTSIQRGPNSPFNAVFIEEWRRDGYKIFRTRIGGERVAAKLSYNYMRDAEKYDLLRTIKAVHCPVMIIHGGADTIVPPEHAKAIFTQANEPKQLIIAEGVDHNFKKPEHEKILADNMALWFGKYLR